MTWDMSTPASPKQRLVTGETVRRQSQVATNARRETDAFETGVPLPPPPATRRPRRQVEPREVPMAQHAELWAFAGTEEGRRIVAMLNEHKSPIQQLRILRAHRSVVQGEPGCWDRWTALLVELTPW